MKQIPIIISAVLALLACGAGESPDADVISDMISLDVAGVIGVEMGDSNYVLGAIQRIDFDSEGNILVLDRSSACIMMYSPEGEFVRQISRQGSGPGELLNPLDMMVLEDGRIAVETPWSGGLHAFSSDGEWLGLLTAFYNNPPMGTVALDDSAYVASRLEVLPDEEGDLVCRAFIGRYELGELPVVTYWNDEFPFDPNDLTGILQNSILGHVITGDRDGNVFMARQNGREYLVQCFRPDGELFLEIEKEIEPVPKTEAEIEEEKIYVEALLESMGASGVVIEWIPDSYRAMISEIEVDGEGRIWVRRGTVHEPVFDVYDYQGEQLFTANVPDAGADARFWDFNIDEHGCIAYSANPELFQQVYILEMP